MVLVITPARRIMVLLLIVGMGTEHMELPLPHNTSLFYLLSLPWSTNVEELPILVTLWREMEEFVQQFLQEFRTSTCFFFSNNMWTFRGFVFLLKMLIWKKKEVVFIHFPNDLAKNAAIATVSFWFCFFSTVCMCVYVFPFLNFFFCVVDWMWNLD